MGRNELNIFIQGMRESNVLRDVPKTLENGNKLVLGKYTRAKIKSKISGFE